ncbi:MAG: pyridoxamine 5'-phosphate oxidase family protein [Candidatus Omnitrophica bacterium]|nr:pyridoxamine 5'-phosphate oxidase family protein [Candidatus Omnitrophota bacterium]
MTKEEILKLINSNLSCHLATLDDGGQPRVRGMMAYRADDGGIIFHTGSTKDLFKQVRDNPLVEACFFDRNTNTQVRVAGKVEIIYDDDLKREIVANRPFLKPWIEELGLDILAVFRMTECVACAWKFEENFAPKTYIKLT